MKIIIKIYICVFLISGCVYVPEKKVAREAKPLLSDAELFGNNNAENNPINLACDLVIIALGKAQKHALSTGENICVILENKTNLSQILIYALKTRNGPKLGQKYDSYELPKSTKFADKKRYLYYNSARKVDFDEDDIRLVVRLKNPKADIIVESRDDSFKQKGLIDLVKNNSHMQLYFTEE